MLFSALLAGKLRFEARGDELVDVAHRALNARSSPTGAPIVGKLNLMLAHRVELLDEGALQELMARTDRISRMLASAA